jgi:hypothetical protein
MEPINLLLYKLLRGRNINNAEQINKNDIIQLS